ncbi:MAG: hypothetical protein KC917_08490, partial [Candidatus Omnitrophica bacterium]|nr:hypothetical protein [Candidatus Omnitrophota bacterium]
GNLITQNSIYLNTGLGIDLRTSFANSGPNFPQDEGDADSGGNGLQNFPNLSSISESATGTIVDGSLSSMPDSMYRLEFFANVGQDGSGFGEGQTYIGSAEVETDGTGVAVFSASVGALPAGQFFVTSTATDITVRAPATEPANNTSEFSPAISMGGQGLTVTTTVGESGGGTLNESILASNNMPGVQTIAFNIPADDPGHVYYRDDGIAGNVTPASVAATTESDDANIADIDPDWPHSWFSIKPLGQIEEITDPVVLDGFSQPGAVENTNPIEDGLNSVLRIEIDGTLASENANDLRFGFMRVTAGGSTIRGLAINRVYGPKIWLDGVYTAGDNNRVEGNYLGPDVSGTVAFPVGYATGVVTTFAGVLINSSSSNLIGGAADSARNLISGNDGFGGAGVLLQGFGSNSNRIQGNLIGTDRTGTRSIGIEQIGVRVGGVVDNTVGGSNPGEGNYIAGNSTGVEIGGHESRRNRVIGNWIGTDSTGSSGIGNTGPGVWVRDSPSHSLIQSNTIAHNDSGVLVVSSFNLLDATRNLITQNSIYRNKGLGIDLGFSSHADGPTPNDVPPESDPPDQDTGANNRQNFPILTSVTDNGGGTTVEGFLQSTPNSNFRIEFFANRERDESTGGKYSEGETYIGSVDVTTDGSGMSGITANLPALPELQPFITATATDITDRGDGPANDTSEFSPVEPLGGESTLVNNTGEIGLGTLREAIYVANLSEGSSTITFAIPPDDPRHFYYMDDGVSGTVSRLNVATTAEADDSNIADIDPDWPHSWFSIQPSHGLPELFDPINIDGFTQPGSVKNTLSAPQGLDSVLRIELDGANIEGDGFSLVVGAEISLIQGLVINRCGANGIHLDTFGGNRVMGNFIGTDVSGTLPLGNGLDGILLDAERYNRVGGAKPELRNLIAGNGSNEIEIKGSGADTVYGNLIGVDRRAQSIIRESTEVCFLVDGSFFAAIGGPEEGSGNFLGVDPEFGIRVSGINPSGFKQTGNPIDQLENCREELLAIQQDRETFFQSNSAEDFDVLDQTTAQFFGCIIFQNFIDQTRANSILQNQYLSEASNLGIDLGTDGATSNDPGDVDEGPNGLQNFPELTTATNEGGTTRVRGNFNSYPGIDYRLEFFSAPTPARAGETYLGFVEVLTDSGGNASFDFISSTSVSSGEYIVSTATLLYDIDADPQ